MPARDPQDHWPTLGPQVVEWVEENLVFGPGDLSGQPAIVSAEMRGLIYSMYEVYPQDHPRAGRRRFHRCCVSQPKGCAKTELGAWMACAELHPEAPVRCDGFDAHGEPVGLGIEDPYIPLLATTEDQSEGLAYTAVRAILLEGPLADDFEAGKLFTARKDGKGKCEAVAAAPLGVDGGRTTFQVFDEEQGLKMRRHHEAHATMELNLTKRAMADPWSLGLGTAPVPGEGSVAEGTWEQAEQIAASKIKDPHLFFFGRWADDQHDLSKGEKTPREAVEAAVIEALGPAAEWRDVPRIADQFYDPQTDTPMWEGRILNRRVRSSRQVFSIAKIREHVDSSLPGRVPARKTPIVIGFDGSRTEDATGLVGTVIETGYQFVIGVWERPAEDAEGWEVPVDEVNEALQAAFERWRVKLVYADPPFWETLVNEWHGKWPKLVVKFHTNQHRKMAIALREYVQAINAGEIAFDGHKDLMRHLGNARKRELNIVADQETGEPFYVMVKDRKNSPLKIDLAMAACLSWQARSATVNDGALKLHGSKPGRSTVYFGR